MTGRRKRRRRRATRDRPTVYAEITQKVIDELEAGSVPWVKPWSHQRPANVTTGHRYRGINPLLLWAAGRPEWPQRWLSYRQAQAAGGYVRKGERGTMVVYAAPFVPKAEREAAAEEDREPRARRMLKRFVVFNVRQCDELPPEMTEFPDLERRRHEPNPEADQTIAATGATIAHGGMQASYSLSEDLIRLPDAETFHTPADYYAVTFHELGHWTRHPDRLDRPRTGEMGSRPYAFEELIAELTAAYLCADHDQRPSVRHSDYIASWIRLLKHDDRAIIRAAAAASAAAMYIRPDSEAAPVAAAAA